jgi:sulfur-oxidizing protein SoxY
MSISIRPRAWFGLCGLFLLIAPTTAGAETNTAWQDLKRDLFESRAIEDGAALLQLEVPARPQDAGLVPVGIKMLRPQSAGWQVKTLSLIVDRNPVPLAATFKLAGNAGISQITTRIRIDQYSDVRVVAETSDGKLYMVSRYVKATGGCSAPAVSGGDEAIAKLGEMRLRQHALQAGPADPARQPASRALVLQLRHPNHSGFQKDPLQGFFIPAHFVQSISIRQGAKPILSVEGGISLSENPSVRFDYLPEGDAEISVRAEDTEGNVFAKSWPFAPHLQHESALRHN